MTHIIVLRPTLGRVSLGFCDTFARLILECSRRGIALSVADCGTPGMLQHARDVLYVNACESEATHAMWWDSDVSFDVDCLFDLLERPEPMIVRPYQARQVDMKQLRQALLDGMPNVPSESELSQLAARWVVELDFEGGKIVERDGLVRVRRTGFGWVLMHTSAMREFLSLHEPIDMLPRDWLSRKHTYLFDGFVGGWDGQEANTTADDWSFCRRWIGSKREIWAAVDRPIMNGDRVGCYRDYLKRCGLLRQ